MATWTLRNAAGEIETVVEDRDMDILFRYLKQSLEDGDYTITGPDTDLKLTKDLDTVYPISGTFRGEIINESTNFFGHIPENN